jgi:hypothetical protein
VFRLVLQLGTGKLSPAARHRNLMSLTYSKSTSNPAPKPILMQLWLSALARLCRVKPTLEGLRPESVRAKPCHTKQPRAAQLLEHRPHSAQPSECAGTAGTHLLLRASFLTPQLAQACSSRPPWAEAAPPLSRGGKPVPCHSGAVVQTGLRHSLLV